MGHAQQRGALCAHGELRNCLYQRQFVSDTRRKSCLQKNFDEVAHERCARSTAGGTLHWCRQEVARRCRDGGVTPSVSHMLDSSLMEGAKDTQVHLSVGTQCRAGNFLLKSRKYCVRLRAML